MTRCSSCNGIVAPTDVHCYVCGEAIPGRRKGMRSRAVTGGAPSSRSSAAGIQLACFASLVMAGWALVSGHRPLVYVGLALCSVLLFSRMVGGRKHAGQQSAPAAPAEQKS